MKKRCKGLRSPQMPVPRFLVNFLKSESILNNVVNNEQNPLDSELRYT